MNALTLIPPHGAPQHNSAHADGEQPPGEHEFTEMQLLLDGIHRRYGYDFSRYAKSSLDRRLKRAKEAAQVTRYTELLDHLYHDPAAFDRFLRLMSVTVTEMFRDPAFYRALREHVVPALRTFPFVKIWHAGCATGEEAYSMAILLEEEGLLNNARIYATDINKQSLDIAQEGVYPARNMEKYAGNYRAAGGIRHLSDYYSAGYDLVKIQERFKERITFSYHNLVTDGVFGEMNLICCRNVLIYFGRDLQNHALQLFVNSLRHGGFLCLGTKESLHFTTVKPLFAPVELSQKIYRKRGLARAIQGALP